MQQQYQPNSWSCLPTSLSMVVDRPLSEILALIGHDGSQILFPNLDDMNRRRNFHVQEIIQVAWQLGYSLTLFENYPANDHGGGFINQLDSTKFVKTTRKVLQTNDAILLCPRHAVAWSWAEQRIFDPRGRTMSLDDLLFFATLVSGKL